MQKVFQGPPNNGEPSVKKFFTRLRLLEAKDPEGKDWDIVVIETGMGLNNRSYTANVLKDAEQLYNNCPVYLFELGKDADHLPDSLVDDKPRLIKHLVGWLRKPLFKSFTSNGKKREGILANFHIDKGSQWLRDKLLDAWKSGVKNLFGFSHDANGDITKFKRFDVEMESVDKITEVSSVELVTNPAQGGQLLRLIASANGEYKMFEKLMEALLGIFKKIDKELVEGIDESAVTDDQFLELVESGIENDKFFEEAQTLEAKGPFMQSIIERVIKLLKGDKKDAAIKALTALQDKLKDYKYPSPAKASATSDPADDDVLTVEDLFPSDVDESAYTDCMKTQMKAGKTMAQAAKVCKVKAKKKGESVEEAAYSVCMKRERDAGKTDAEADKICKLEAKKKDKGGAEESLKRIKSIEESIKVTQCATVLDQKLKESKLFTPVLAKVRKQYEGKIFKESDLDTTLAAEQDTLAKLSKSGNLSGLGQSKVEVRLDESDKKQIAMDLLFGVELKEKDKKGVGGFRGIKEAYRSMNPDDPDITFTRQRPKRITEATMITSDFDNAMGVSMTKKMLKIYKLLGMPYKEFCNVVPIADFKTQERIRWGGFGEFPTVLEDGTYDNIAFPTDEKATYGALTKGGTFSIGRRAIKNDDMNMLRQIPTRLARAAAKTLNSFVWAFMVANSTIYDNAALFTTARGNLGSDALDFDSLGVAVTAMKSMREKGNYIIEGTASSGGNTTLTLDAAGWSANAYQYKYVRLVDGTGVGQYRYISSNTTDTLTVSVVWTTNPDSTSKFEVFAYVDEKIGIKPAFLAGPTELERTIDLILENDYEPDSVERNKNTLKGVAKKMIVGTLTDANDWYLIGDKTWLDLFELGFIDGKEEPMILVQDQPNVGKMFTQDQITYKVRHEYGGAPVDYRGFYKAVVG